MDPSNSTAEAALITKAKTGVGNTTRTCGCNPSMACDFCEKLGHCIHECHTMIWVNKQRKERQTAGHSGQGNKQNTNKALMDPRENPEPNRNLSTSDPNGKTEHADKASSTMTPKLSNSIANRNWNADMGASTHMTPHWHWI